MNDDRRPPDDASPEAPSPVEMLALVRVVLWAALIALGAWLSIPLAGVPISFQNFFVLLAGLMAGPKIGASAAGLYLLAGFLGLPVFSGGLGGPAILFRPSAGFALAFPLGAAAAGLIGRRRRGRPSFLRTLTAALIGDLVIYAGGYIGLLLVTDLRPEAAALLLLPLIPGDLLKFVVIAWLASRKTA